MQNQKNKHKFKSTISYILFAILIIIQTVWLKQVLDTKEEKQHFELIKLIPEISLEVNKNYRKLFHKDSFTANQQILNQIEIQIDSMLKLNKIHQKFYFAFYRDTDSHIFTSNDNEFKQELMESKIKSPISNIISYSFITEDSTQTASQYQFQHYVSRENTSSTTYLSLYIPENLFTHISNVLPQFLISIVLLIWLIYLLNIQSKNLNNFININKLKSNFFNQVSHEFKIPISAIRLASKTIQKTKSEENKIRYHQLIEKECLRIENHVNQILDFAKVSSPKLKLEKTRFNWKESLFNLEERIKLIQSDNEFHFHWKINTDKDEFTGDKELLESCIFNLIENSIKHSNKTVEVVTEIKEGKDKLQILIRDNGSGIPIEDQNRIFEQFYRSQQNNTYKTKGFGLGLPYVKSVIESHQGNISLNHKLSSGCEFIIELPLEN